MQVSPRPALIAESHFQHVCIWSQHFIAPFFHLKNKKQNMKCRLQYFEITEDLSWAWLLMASSTSPASSDVYLMSPTPPHTRSLRTSSQLQQLHSLRFKHVQWLLHHFQMDLDHLLPCTLLLQRKNVEMRSCKSSKNIDDTIWMEKLWINSQVSSVWSFV